jgi:hypothetical protein
MDDGRLGGVQVVISHPKLVETGLDLLDFPTIIFYESGYSLHTLRQASRRSWRIGQRGPVRVKFLCDEGTMQTACLRLMGKKLLVALTMEGKFAGEGLQNIDEDDDMLSAMVRELVHRGIRRCCLEGPQHRTSEAVFREYRFQQRCFFDNPAGCFVRAPVRPGMYRGSSPSTLLPGLLLDSDRKHSPVEGGGQNQLCRNRRLYLA